MFFWTSFALRGIQIGELSNSTWHVPETEASHANLSRVVDCFTGDIHHSRETGPPEKPQREVRRPLAQSRSSAAPHKNTRPPQTTRAPTRSRLRSEFDRCIPVAAACVGIWGCASHPRHPKRDSLFGGAGRNNRPLPAAPRGGRGLSTRLVGCPLVFVDSCALLDLKKTAIPR